MYLYIHWPIRIKVTCIYTRDSGPTLQGRSPPPNLIRRASDHPLFVLIMCPSHATWTSITFTLFIMHIVFRSCLSDYNS